MGRRSPRCTCPHLVPSRRAPPPDRLARSSPSRARAVREAEGCQGHLRLFLARRPAAARRHALGEGEGEGEGEGKGAGDASPPCLRSRLARRTSPKPRKRPRAPLG